MIGLTAYSRGDFVEARTHCERALEAPDTKPDPNVAQGFSADSIVSSAYLAPTLWVLGHVERARELINTATRRAAEIDVPAMADALHWKVDLEILRDDPAATLSAAESLEVSRKRTTWRTGSMWPNWPRLGPGVASTSPLAARRSFDRL